MNRRGRPRFLWIVCALFSQLEATNAGAQERGVPRIAVQDSMIFYDRSFDLEVHGLAPGKPVTLTVTASDARGQEWWSQNVYLSDDRGTLDLAVSAPIRGTYSGREAEGPFWSMVGAARFYTHSSATLTVRVAQDRDNAALRWLTWLSPRDHPSISREEIRRGGLVADLYLPEDREGPVPVVVVVGGSGGGFNGERASLLATHGYAALDVAYFGVDGTPRYFVESQPLEYFMAAISMLSSDERLDTSRIAVMGKSFGAQLALTLASVDPRIDAVVAEAPSSIVTGTAASYPVGPPRAAWSLEGRALPFFRGGTAASTRESAVIPVERINGPVLLISGEEDRIWESTAMANEVVARLDDHDFEYPVRHVRLEDAGHNTGGGEEAFGVPNLPAKERTPSPGGTKQGNAVGSIVAWREALAFLNSHLARDPGS